jgi:predicted nucleotide-binding protein (sugar kinase/HSP70/actin superfamily)
VGKRNIISGYYEGITAAETSAAVKAAYAEYNKYITNIRKKGKEYITEAKKRHMKIIILAGRPYHLDEEINHGIDKMICELGAAVVSEDTVCDEIEKIPTGVLNQWTYHSRMYAAAKYVTRSERDINLVQLVSFGCGVDAITTDEIRSILENADRIYTQIKIDEITNLGAVKIRLRSLFAALEQN